jgi:hypothetical protein
MRRDYDMSDLQARIKAYEEMDEVAAVLKLTEGFRDKIFAARHHSLSNFSREVVEIDPNVKFIGGKLILRIEFDGTKTW